MLKNKARYFWWILKKDLQSCALEWQQARVSRKLLLLLKQQDHARQRRPTRANYIASWVSFASVQFGQRSDRLGPRKPLFVLPWTTRLVGRWDYRYFPTPTALRAELIAIHGGFVHFQFPLRSWTTATDSACPRRTALDKNDATPNRQEKQQQDHIRGSQVQWYTVEIDVLNDLDSRIWSYYTSMACSQSWLQKQKTNKES
jgi:hypothetical protein